MSEFRTTKPNPVETEQTIEILTKLDRLEKMFGILVSDTGPFQGIKQHISTQNKLIPYNDTRAILICPDSPNILRELHSSSGIAVLPPNQKLTPQQKRQYSPLSISVRSADIYDKTTWNNFRLYLESKEQPPEEGGYSGADLIVFAPMDDENFLPDSLTRVQTLILRATRLLKTDVGILLAQIPYLGGSVDSKREVLEWLHGLERMLPQSNIYDYATSNSGQNEIPSLKEKPNYPILMLRKPSEQMQKIFNSTI